MTHWSDRPYLPIEAAKVASQYLTFDAGFFLKQCEIAGLNVGTDGKLIHMRTSDPLALTEQQQFLRLWLRIGDSGKLLRRSLKRRGLFDYGEAI